MYADGNWRHFNVLTALYCRTCVMWLVLLLFFVFYRYRMSNTRALREDRVKYNARISREIDHLELNIATAEVGEVTRAQVDEWYKRATDLAKIVNKGQSKLRRAYEIAQLRFVEVIEKEQPVIDVRPAAVGDLDDDVEDGPLSSSEEDVDNRLLHHLLEPPLEEDFEEIRGQVRTILIF